ncbi:MAG: hypothetical protein KF716_21225 [Anaerolineae bacterium]|nr:hypothetical protein [Anaerolineae bacterium]
MSNNDDYDDDFNNLERGMLDDQESDDFANFDPERYLKRRSSGALVGDDRDEVELGVGRSRRRRSSVDDDDDVIAPRSSYRSRTASGSRSRREDRTATTSTYRGRGIFSGVTDLLTGVLFSGPIAPYARPLIIGFGCLVLTACLALCGIAVWFLTTPR